MDSYSVLEQTKFLKKQVEELNYSAYDVKQYIWLSNDSTIFYDKYINCYEPKTLDYIYAFEYFCEQIENTRSEIQSLMNQ